MDVKDNTIVECVEVIVRISVSLLRCAKSIDVIIPPYSARRGPTLLILQPAMPRER